MESLARWSTTHRKRVVAAWIVLLVVSLGAASSLKNHFDNNLTLPNTGTQRASDLLESHFPAVAGELGPDRLQDQERQTDRSGKPGTRAPHDCGGRPPSARRQRR